jgi:hypothetical protein
MNQKSYDPILAANKFNNNMNYFQPLLQTNLINDYNNKRMTDVSISLTSNEATNAVINHGNEANNQVSLTTTTERLFFAEDSIFKIIKF